MTAKKIVAPVVPTAKLGAAVYYIGSKGLPKLAYVTGTPESIKEGTSLPTLEQGYLHLAVLAAGKSNFQSKLSVPAEALAKQDPEFPTQEDGILRNVWLPIE